MELFVWTQSCNTTGLEGADRMTVARYSPTRWWNWWGVTHQVMQEFGDDLPSIQCRLQVTDDRAATQTHIEEMPDPLWKASLQSCQRFWIRVLQCFNHCLSLKGIAHLHSNAMSNYPTFKTADISERYCSDTTLMGLLQTYHLRNNVLSSREIFKSATLFNANKVVSYAPLQMTLTLLLHLSFWMTSTQLWT